jgi:hypothetical protein
VELSDPVTDPSPAITGEPARQFPERQGTSLSVETELVEGSERTKCTGSRLTAAGRPSDSPPRDGVQRGVRRPVAASVKPVAVGAPGAGRDGRDTAQVGEGGFGAQPLGVVAGGGQELAGDLSADPGKG